ncbi:hypothetical protein FHS88_004052 [Roseomonas alkaliterrae]|uniref:Uncharacterized protein n=1 Tax=Neoroseomonas alkaliterrae TaxID=1452450 RepID=A0A840Y7G5_9PROT|nr:hypothetical protein [Neoroseomonas alkaliterrae]
MRRRHLPARLGLRLADNLLFAWRIAGPARINENAKVRFVRRFKYLVVAIVPPPPRAPDTWSTGL